MDTELDPSKYRLREHMTVVPVAEYQSVISSTNESERIASLVELLRSDGSKKWILDCIHEYLQALAVYTHGATSYSVIEIPKLKIADAVLICLGYPLEPIAKESLPPTSTSNPDKYKKIPIPEELRWKVFERDGFKCVHCGAQKFLRADHVIAESKGGLATLDNLQTLCRNCNSRKGAK